MEKNRLLIFDTTLRDGEQSPGASLNIEEKVEIAHQLEEMIHEDCSFIPGWVRPFLQCAYWRWVQWPEGFAGKLAREHDQLNVHWLDPSIKAETEAAMKAGTGFGQTTRIIDQHRISN